MARRLFAVVLLLLAAVPASASGAGLVNGGFESGNLAGWHAVDSGAGDWFAYQGTDAPIGHHRSADPVQAPAQGSYAAITDEADPATLILYQDLTLEPGSDYQLSLLAYYDSYAPIAVPGPDTLATDEETLGPRKNQQFRIDLIRPQAPFDTLEPADLLGTLFRTKPGAPRRMGPTRFTADLAPYAGQTVRLRIAVAAHEEVLNAGVDAVALTAGAGGPGGGPGHSGFRIVRTKTNARKGAATVVLSVPGPGWLTLRKRHRSLAPVGARAARARQIVLHVRLTPRARRALRREGRLRVRASLAWEPDQGQVEAVPLSIPFLLKNS